MTTALPTFEEHDRSQTLRARASSFIGSAVEYYDFLLYGAAAGLVFPHLFFANLPTALGVTLSYAILFTGYAARPIGGLLFGHFGDKLGRKRMLFITLLVMGLVSITIGLMPGSGTIGVAAPIILVFLRIIQGLAVGGEWAGATLMSMEHSGKGTKGFGASLAIAGAPMGAVLATLVLAVFSRRDDFMDWSWRVPFLLSFIVVLVGLYLRTQIKESPEFEAARRRGEVHTNVPIVEMWTKYRKDVVLGILAAGAPLFLQGLLAVWAVPYVVAGGAVTRSDALLMLTLSNALHIFTIPASAWLSDRLGRRPVMIGGAILSAVGIWGMFALFNTNQPTLIALAFILGNPILQASMYGPIGAFLGEKFDANARYTGVSLTYQFGSLIGGGVAPLIANQFVGASRSTTHLALYMTIFFIISGIAVVLSRETRHQQSPAERFVAANIVD
ncbi:Sugar phosphate permease [Raineyella antarctica]|uniref:Sugar phosphate permease n=1 Tax=Raineyella antarctica TaxID=1577474 RepID=A0A1G6I4I6_9ACTN|nr:MFS transporter [Raineyella antarctica]SDC01283.1 Sugar phosphate permease [Raineyella antarctica]